VSRQKWALWLTQEMETELDRFEREKLPLMGGPAQSVENDGPASNQSSIGMVITKLRDALRIEKLTTLRNDLVDRSYGDRRIVQGKKVRL